MNSDGFGRCIPYIRCILTDILSSLNIELYRFQGSQFDGKVL